MKRIQMTKYGFVRWPEEDFSDDGNRFTCYRAGKAVRVSKLIADGQAYLSISSTVGKGTLPYEVYQKLPHYSDANWKWNGVKVESLTDQDLQDFYQACILYEQEYEEAESKIHYPSLEELQAKAEKVSLKFLRETMEIEKLLGEYGMEAATKFSQYEWRMVQESIQHLIAEAKRFDPETFPQTIVGTSRSFTFVAPNYLMEESYWFTRLKELFNKYCVIV